jgi:hypothetical protein
LVPRSPLWALALFSAVNLRAASAQPLALVPPEQVWAYYVATNAPSNPADAWRQLEFDDTHWPRGPAGFGYPPEISALPGPGAWLTVCFRTRFELPDPAQVAWLVLRADYDDGLVVYVNGVEAARRALPTDGPVWLDTPAHPVGRTYGDEIRLTVPADTLVPGTNVVAVELHKTSTADNTAVLLPELLANFHRGPLVENLSTDRIQITWRTPVATDTRLQLGLSGGALAEVFRDDVPTTEHAVVLTNLMPDTRYRYQVAGGDGTRAASSPEFEFETLALAGPISFAVVGDTGSGQLAQRQVAQLLGASPGRFILHVGDLIYPDWRYNLVDLRHFSVYRDLLARKPMFTVAGNHDLYAGDAPYLAAFNLPTNAISGTEHFYSFDHGDVHFVGLFLTMRDLDHQSRYAAHAMAEGSPQYQWLTNDLAQTAKPWKIVFAHSPVASSGPHRLDWYDGRYDYEVRRQLLVPLFARYGVQLFLAGHDHAYERLGPLEGVHLVVTGGGGYPLYPLSRRDPASIQFYYTFHCLRVWVDADTLSAEAVDTQGAVFDEFTVRRRAPPPQVYPSAWHTPRTPDGPSDGDGNVAGQIFDFSGAAIPSVAGRAANLGRLQVSVDREFLYLGFRDLMAPNSNSLVVFVESPHLPGVSNLWNLGNGVADPTGQGADGLDALENLEFRRFQPAFACLLGDEYADGTYRSFVRWGTPFDPGQGVFRLDAALTSVAGARVQQFNRSPQREPIPGEQQADLIQVAIPLNELGGLKPGELVRLGALSAVAGANTNTGQLHAAIDPAYLGWALDLAGAPSAILEPIEVRAAEDPDPDSDGLTTADELDLGTNPNHPDTDGDALTDGWEHAYGLDPLRAMGDDGADGDPDGDGVVNLDEQAAGTHPRDPTSALRLRLHSPGGDVLELVWRAVPGRRYQVQIAYESPSQFADLPLDGFPRLATSTTESVLLPFGAVATHSRYYRVRLVP